MKEFYYVNPEVQYLLINHSTEKEPLIYNEKIFYIPQIGVRPPFFKHPRYKPYFPII